MVLGSPYGLSLTNSNISKCPAIIFWTIISLHTDLVLRHAVDTHGGDGGEHHSDGHQTEELAGDGVSRVLQRQPQTLPDVPITHLLEVLHVSVRVEDDEELTINSL